MITLYQMVLSNYCEKVRWMLSYKKLPYKTKNLLPGLHAKPVKKLSQQTSVPVIVDDGQVVANSSDILSYIDKEYPRFSIALEGEKATDANIKEVDKWESIADQKIGVFVRQISYFTLINHPDIVIPMFAKDGPWYSGFLLNRMFPKMQTKMKKIMHLDEHSVHQSMKDLCGIRDKILTALETSDYLVADTFTRADLSVASVFAPFFAPQKYGLDWPKEYPEPLQSMIKEFEALGPWVHKMYDRHR